MLNIEDKTKNTLLRKACPRCGKVAVEKRSRIEEGFKIINLECGHTILEDQSVVKGRESIISLSGKEPFQYQYDTIDFAAKNNFRSGIFHEQRVGKTVCALAAVAQYPEKLLPFVIVCKGSLTVQWWHEIFDWTNKIAQTISNGKEDPIPGFDAYIITYDLLRNRNPFADLGIKLVILDECQQIKNSKAKRTQGIRGLVRDVPHVFGLSGTPIKNHSGEYFPILNILDPLNFPTEAGYIHEYLNYYDNGYGPKVGGFTRSGADRFKEVTRNLIIRYTRDEVLPFLPKKFRNNYFVELGPEVEEEYKRAYIDAKEEFEEGDGSFEEQGNLLAKLNKLRHITGRAKIAPVTEWVRDYLESCDRKLVLFVHHKDVGEGLLKNLTEICNEMGILPPLQLTSANASKDEGFEIDRKFKTDPNQRIMIASTLSAGEGKNWHMCSDAVLVELQWNPANEEQPEDRFLGVETKANKVNIMYPIALGTPDEYLTEIKERKREICKRTYGHEAIEWNQTSVIKEMSELLFTKGAKKWNL